MRQLEVHPQVYEELEEARFWYENCLAGLGTKFLDQVDLAMTVIKKSPEVCLSIFMVPAGILFIVSPSPYYIATTNPKFRLLP